MPVVNIKGVGPAQFPDGMSADDIRSFLRKKYYQDMASKTPTITPLPHTAAPYEPTLAERLGRNIGDILTDTGIVSDNYGAQRIGSNIASIGEFLPVIGDASAGDDFGRAAADGDKLGMGLASLGVIPIAGDALKKYGEDALYKVHNITEGGLKKADEFGGIPVPSLAVASKGGGFDSFGDISLVGKSERVES